jgi:DNA-binding PadR family transcriptional regulator
MQQGAVLAMLAKEPAHGYQLRARLRQALGPVGEDMNDGQIYVTLTRLEKAGLVTAELEAGLPDRSDRKLYALTPAGQQRVAGWLAGVSWPKPDLAELLRRLREAQRAALEGIVLRLQADLRWLQACEQQWTNQKERDES